MTINKPQYHGIMDPPEYDGIIQTIIPHHSALLQTVIEYLPLSPGRILELGCGTGILTEFVHEIFPEAEIIGIDLSREMLNIASAKQSLTGTRFIEGDIRGEWPDGQFDAIITTLCLHHLSRKERGDIIQRASRALTPEGRFICGDIFRAEQEWEEDLLLQSWGKAMKYTGASDEIVTEMMSQRRKRKPLLSTVSWFQAKMRDAGFSHTFVPFNAGFVGLVVGIQ
jgi:tRNA (cmo5U34)-methyltransferase